MQITKRNMEKLAKKHGACPEGLAWLKQHKSVHTAIVNGVTQRNNQPDGAIHRLHSGPRPARFATFMIDRVFRGTARWERKSVAEVYEALSKVVL